MKNTFTTLAIIATLILSGISISKASSKTKEKTAKESTVQLTKGKVQVLDYGSYKLHAYYTKDLMNDVCVIVEKDNKAALIESPAFWDNFDEFRKYITDNNITIEGMLPAYHPLGANFIATSDLKNVDIYFTQNGFDYWEKGFGAVMKAGIPKTFGDKVDSEFYVPTQVVEEGEIEVAGIKMIIHNSFDGFDIEIPELKTVYVHILGHDTHSEILGEEHLNSSIKHFKSYLKKGYTTFLSSHYGPETKVDMETKVAYLKDMKTIVAKSHTAEEFTMNMKAAYPDYKEGYLPATARSFYSNVEVGHQH